MKTLLEGKFNRKIHTAASLAQVLAPFPREKRVVMCHGTFDIVHPGHIRHLLYAREKGDILVVSLTCDEHILKANYRPHVPETLRAMNLAALEMVDHVVIDRNATPIENIRLIKPDLFVKGYEYGSGALPPKTQEEKNCIESYGGEIIFTPGDVVFSSSAIIESKLPNLAVEKLALLMQVERVSFADLKATLSRMAGLEIHVVGDTIVDTQTHTELIGANAKTPTFSVRYAGKTDFVGGAGIVAKHLRAAHANVTFTTVLGDDALKDFVLKDLAMSGVRVNAIVDRTRPTTNKNAFVADGYRLLKVDTLDNRSISDRVLGQIVDAVGTSTDTVVFSDFRHGIFNRSTIPTLIEAIPAKTFRVADSQVASRWGNILEFRNFDLITPNEKEARFALADQDSVVRPLGSRLYREAGCKVLMLKMGARGMMTFRGHVEDPSDDRTQFFGVDSFVDVVRDPVGTGDALLAYASLALKATGNSVIASILGAAAAAVECEIDGNSPVSPEAVQSKLDILESRAQI